MMSYLLPLLAIVALCTFWAVFQLWLSRHDPDAGKRMQKCGNCGCETPCDESGSESSGELQPLR